MTALQQFATLTLAALAIFGAVRAGWALGMRWRQR